MASVNDRLTAREYYVAVALTLLTVSLHTVFLINAGGFWRDEANSIAIALKPSMTDIWMALKVDSHPVLHILLLRAWAAVFGPGDFSLRFLGFSIGLGIIASLWSKTLGFGNRPPLLSLLLVGISPVMVRSLDTARAYGIAALSVIVAFTVIWRTVRKPTPAHVIVSTLMLTLCVQALYQSAVVVLAIGIAALLVGLLRGGLRRASLLAIPFCLSAISLLPYAGHVREARNWWPLARNPLGSKLLQPFIEAISSPTAWSMLLWIAVVILAIIGSVHGFAQIRFGEEEQKKTEWHFLLYCGITFAATIICVLIFFIYMVGPITFQVWYYALPLVLAAVSAEPLIDHVIKKRLRGLYVIVIATSAIIAFIPAARNLTMRMTSIDIAAAFIEKKAGPNDLVIVVPWYYGVSLSRYYHGRAPWQTFPALEDTSIHRYDLLKEKMKQPQTITEDLKKISSTLQSGGIIWVVGRINPKGRDRFVTSLPPPPLPTTGWSSAPYTDNWGNHLMSVLFSRTHEYALVPLHANQQINPLETAQIAAFRGWIP
ncbi:conserved membrane hypothetical protein [Candidatus Sulfobium mesophilum]|uniref:Glycosyltransferase RgtA/B/C/D-like domain-containing protein n=1 Tax=Candidatus Sulfobium mesophilum TaxID=2016548 RepID=A0A2U3QL90_9BACT|nr:conserved membrane hypothetical protein [Candidatus Sulfobium mesophilum]